MTAAVITFRAKVREIINADGSRSAYIDYKRNVARSDCNLRPHQHTYYNSDLFAGMLRRAYQTAIAGREWCRLTDLPPAVAADATGFLAVVTVTLPADFR